MRNPNPSRRRVAKLRPAIDPEKMFVRRVRCTLGAFLGVLGLIALRAADLQIYQHAHLTRLAKEQYLNTVKVPARRGHIYDRSGNPLAISVDVPSVFANPAAVVDPRSTARTLARILESESRTLLERLTSGRYFTWLKRHISPAVANQIEALKIPGIRITKEPRRFYPHREVGAHVIGFAGLDARGLEGVEKQFDADLLGEPQVVPAVRDARGHAVLAGGLDPTQRSRGNDLYLTLDLQLQHVAQTAVERVLQTSRAKAASAIILDVASAEVLAMAAVPGFNPNQGGQEKPERRRNRVVTDIFEPGSTLKPLVLGAALDAGVIDPKTILFCENGRFAIGGHSISDTSPHDFMGLTEILAKSSNIGMAKIAQALGKEQLFRALRNFGVAQRTGVELPGEVAGVLRPFATWSDLETATIAFGQGMAVNGLQLAAIYRALAADGLFKEPRLVHHLERPDGTVIDRPSPPARRVLRPATARRLTLMLEASVAPDQGTGRLAAVQGYRVAGKTGTAQKADALTGGYSHDRYLALFAGFLPANAPRVVIVVAVDEPQTSHYGGTIAAPVFAEIGLAAMQRFGVLATSAPQVAATPATQPEPVDDVPVVDTPTERPGTMPSFLGLMSRQAVARYTELGLGRDLALRGTGRVVSQEPAAGSARPADRHVRLTLAP